MMPDRHLLDINLKFGLVPISLKIQETRFELTFTDKNIFSTEFFHFDILTQ